jgi:hypothetical protein
VFKSRLSHLLLMLPTAAFIALSSPTFAEEPPMKTIAVAEIVSFKLAKGVDVDAFLQANAEVAKFLKEQPGFVSRNLSRRADGSFMDYAVWTTLDNAKTAMDASMQAPALAPFMQSIDMTSMDLKHEEILMSVVK